MKISFFKRNKKENSFLGKKDEIVRYDSKWPIYLVDGYDPNGLLITFENVLEKLEKEKKLLNIDQSEFQNFFTNNPDVDFEILFFKNIMNKHYLFKINDQIYSYSIGQKNKKKYFIRFYFDIKNFLLFYLSS